MSDEEQPPQNPYSPSDAPGAMASGNSAQQEPDDMAASDFESKLRGGMPKTQEALDALSGGGYQQRYQ